MHQNIRQWEKHNHAHLGRISVSLHVQFPLIIWDDPAPYPAQNLDNTIYFGRGNERISDTAERFWRIETVRKKSWIVSDQNRSTSDWFKSSAKISKTIGKIHPNFVTSSLTIICVPPENLVINVVNFRFFHFWISSTIFQQKMSLGVILRHWRKFVWNILELQAEFLGTCSDRFTLLQFLGYWWLKVPSFRVIISRFTDHFWYWDEWIQCETGYYIWFINIILRTRLSDRPAASTLPDCIDEIFGAIFWENVSFVLQKVELPIEEIDRRAAANEALRGIREEKNQLTTERTAFPFPSGPLRLGGGV
jgi:hypothetical protein